MNLTNKTIIAGLLSLLTIFSVTAKDKIPALKDSVPFPIGAAINPMDIYGSNEHNSLIKDNFNVIVAENAMKPDYIARSRNQFDFSTTDKIIDFAQKNNIAVRWHTLCWHSQTPGWLTTGANGKQATKEEALENLRNYIFTVMEHNKGKNISSYDVVNECLSDSTGRLRDYGEGSRWYATIGSDYVDYAFKYAHEADPDAFLVINDYSLESNPIKRQAMYKLVKGMKERGIQVDGIGLQMHIDIYGPSASEIKSTIDYFAELGVKVLVTEMDMSLYSYNDRSTSLSSKKLDKALDKQAQRYKEIFDVFREEYNAGKLSDVLLWGLEDGSSWKNGFPVKGRTDYPLLFDRQMKPKDCLKRIIKK